MIENTNKGYIVKSETGKKLSKPFKKKSDAVKRLKQIEYFKKKGE